MFTIALGIIALKFYDVFALQKQSQENGILEDEVGEREKKSRLFFGSVPKVLAVLLIGVIAEIGEVDYGIFGILLIFSFYIFKDSRFKTLIVSSAVVSGKYLFRMASSFRLNF